MASTTKPERIFFKKPLNFLQPTRKEDHCRVKTGNTPEKSQKSFNIRYLFVILCFYFK